MIREVLEFECSGCHRVMQRTAPNYDGCDEIGHRHAPDGWIYGELRECRPQLPEQKKFFACSPECLVKLAKVFPSKFVAKLRENPPVFTEVRPPQPTPTE